MSSNEKDYSSYLAWESMVTQGMGLFCGFTFTAITLLLTLLPDLNTLSSQVALLFLAFLYNLFQYQMLFDLHYASFCYKDVPPETKGRRLSMWLSPSFSLWGIAIVLMFLLWNLTYLALASGIIYALFTILAVNYVWKPVLERSRKMRSKAKG